ncbi:SDR family NAD(P)-dependent oxidoreductase [Acidithiobacillus sp. CV18-2]|uniref:SDR family NAD(P)-dependent oxidoreductase n=1 Tax=Igneacidithiobacillus copahuensis TaxID=2724909 RepID=A0AAE2YRY8_9PROT|nr:SDR family NAD(P)-dependent oxidoreductase [Igneacidithiobacillus copahuensis]MBU2755728.1 SDR family NAD(P)-dependent oxidoreductase [Acidithiobacillus sp. CV18-3]MBU2757071.1 SDR family NAD(P)-dependent oxidoreductase [Acidithiobacillus sp. BN09-2]MBU2778547.1 SDR family NAD(P)-dependent oxidoreductase [Acidithiobacillus sp. CV18-2]MBU2797681.1 SDR family NAD(P)-dependent oxidoreductase [Acidithiobacillus sp. VAN18-2]MBU2798161.1 SDR family NAD(P)-dependent oxidoreductase [Acidithiobacill
MTERQKTAVVTGASSGIGAATVQVLCAAGYHVILAARRRERLEKIAREYGGMPLELDVTSSASVAAFAAQIDIPVDVLVNNAGGALGKESLVEFDEEHWLQMYQSNVLGLARVTRALWPRLQQSPAATVINIGSVAGEETYAGGAGYTACKHAVRAISETMRLEWLGQPIRVTEIDPGLVETEFSLVRFAGDAKAAKAVYEGMAPLVAEDIAEAIRWVVSLPEHVNIDRLVIKPRDQARVDKVARR